MNERVRIFISSVQRDLANDRRALNDPIHEDRLLGRFFNGFRTTAS